MTDKQWFIIEDTWRNHKRPKLFSLCTIVKAPMTQFRERMYILIQIKGVADHPQRHFRFYLSIYYTTPDDKCLYFMKIIIVLSYWPTFLWVESICVIINRRGFLFLTIEWRTSIHNIPQSQECNLNLLRLSTNDDLKFIFI